MPAPGIMAVWNDLEPGHELEFETWYRRQHVPERLRVAGFREARRYAALNGSPRYCAFYWLDSIEILGKPEYRDRLANPTAWTQRMMPRFLGMARTPCRLAMDRGEGLGGAMCFIASLGRAGAAPVAVPAEVDAIFADCLEDPACMRLQLWECDPAIAALDNPEMRFRSHRDRYADWIVCIETAEPGSAGTHAGAVAQRLRAAAPQADLLCAPVYRLLWRMVAGEAPLPWPDSAWPLRTNA